MAENSKSEYEDSYEKEERLERELSLVLDNLKRLSKIGKKDMGRIDHVSEDIIKIGKEIDQLKELGRQLKLDLDKINADHEKITDLDDKIDAQQRIGEQQSKIWENWTKQDDLYKELFKIYEEDVGFRGDINGTISLIDSELKKAEETRKELENLRKDDY